MNTKTPMWSSIILLALTCGACSGSAAGREEAPAARSVDVSSGTVVAVRLSQALSTNRNNAGDSFAAILDEPVAVGGVDVIPKGTKFTGHVTTADTSGRLKGRGVLGITLDTFDLNGQS